MDIWGVDTGETSLDAVKDAGGYAGLGGYIPYDLAGMVLDFALTEGTEEPDATLRVVRLLHEGWHGEPRPNVPDMTVRRRCLQWPSWRIF